MDDYIIDFRWDLARYQVKQPLRTLVDVIVKVYKNNNELNINSKLYKLIEIKK